MQTTFSLKSIQNKPLPPQYATAAGPLDYGLINDFMFRAVFEANPKALKGLICSLLRMKEKDIKQIVVTNPIELGSTFDAKTFVLDLKVLLNNYTTINLEMQVVKQDFWQDRSLCYTCRTFDILNRGEPYHNIKPVIHIGLLDFDPFPEYPEFYSTFHLANDKNHMIYSDKFRVSVVQLNRTEIATAEDVLYELTHWAELFKATTWEEVKMLAEKNNAISEAAETLYRMSNDARIRERCQAQEDYNRLQRTMQGIQEELQQQLWDSSLALKQTQDELKSTSSELKSINDELKSKNDELKSKDDELKSKNDELKSKDDELKSKDDELKSKDDELKSKDDELKSKNDELKKMQAENARLQALLKSKNLL